MPIQEPEGKVTVLSSRRVLVAALVGLAAYFMVEPEAPADLAARAGDASDDAPAPAERPAPRHWRAAPDAANGRIAPLEAAAPVPLPSPIATPSPLPPVVPPPPAPTAASPYIVVSQPVMAPAPDPGPAQLLELARMLEVRMRRLDARLDELASRPAPTSSPGPSARYLGAGAGPTSRPVASDRPFEDEPAEAEASEGARAMRLIPRQNPQAETARGFELAVRLIRRLMKRVEKLEDQLDVQPDSVAASAADVEAPATGQWRQAPPVMR